MQRERVINRDLHQVSTFSSVTNFLDAKTVSAGISTIHSGGLPIDILVSPAKSNTTIFFFHGAIEPHFTLPVLSGLGISGGLEANRVFVSDPSLTLDEDLMLAWYAGNYKQPDLQQSLVSVFRKILETLRSDRAVFFGGSGGGFASLYFASRFDNSLAVVFNPQTIIANYAERPVRDFTEKAFHLPHGLELPLNSLPSHIITNICDIYKKPIYTTIIYMQNSNDSLHLQLHLAPFLEALHPENKLLLMNEPWREGHSPPPKKVLTRVLNLVASPDEWTAERFTGIGLNNISGAS